jgi:hypothetical protein
MAAIEQSSANSCGEANNARQSSYSNQQLDPLLAN